MREFETGMCEAVPLVLVRLTAIWSRRFPASADAQYSASSLVQTQGHHLPSRLSERPHRPALQHEAGAAVGASADAQGEAVQVDDRGNH